MRGSLQERSGMYYGVFRINGKQRWFRLDIPTTKGNRRKAQSALNKLIAEYEKNPNVFYKIPFIDYIHKWLEGVAKAVDEITYQGYKQYAENISSHIFPKRN